MLGDDEPGDCKPRRDQGPRGREKDGERKREGRRFARPKSLSYPCNQCRGRKCRDAFENRRSKQWWEQRWLRDTEQHDGRRGGGGSGAPRMETSQSKTIGNHPGTTCANYFAKQFLAIVGRRRCESRSTVTILVRSGRYNVAGQCLSIQTSVSDVATRLLDVRVPWPHGGLLIQLFVPERDWSRLAGVPPKLLSRRTCERQLCESSRYVPINPIMQYIRIRYVNVKMWFALRGIEAWRRIERTDNAFLTRHTAFR